MEGERARDSERGGARKGWRERNKERKNIKK
jgi:hypothetical protein